MFVPPKFCISIAFIFSWDHSKSQEKMETVFIQNFGGQTNKQTNKEYYGIFESGLLSSNSHDHFLNSVVIILVELLNNNNNNNNNNGLFNTCFRTRVKYMFTLTTYPENFKSYKIYYMLIEKKYYIQAI